MIKKLVLKNEREYIQSNTQNFNNRFGLKQYKDTLHTTKNK